MAQVTAQNANLQAGEWHHVAFTLDMENKKVLLWVNNMNVASTVVDESSIPTFSPSTNVKLGSDGTSQFEGLMDNIVIYEKHVSDEELKQIMNYRDPELYLKKALESYITFDKFRTNLDAEGVVIDAAVVSEGEPVKDFSNKSVRISAPSSAPIVKTNSEMKTDSMSVGSWIKPVSVTERDMEVFGKEGVFSLGVKQGGEMTFELGNEDISTKQFVVHKDTRETVTPNSGSLSFPETAAARAEATLASGSYFASEFTMSMWFKVDSFATTRTLMSGMGFSTESSNKGLCVENGSLYMYDAANTLIVQVGNIVADQWYHLVLTDESLLLNYRKYEYTKSPIWTNDKVLKLGNNYSNNKNFLGHIDEFVLYTKRLDPLAIYELFKGTYPSKFESLVVVKYEFDDSGTPGKDSGSAGINLTLTSATHSTTVLPFESKTLYAPMRGPDGIIKTHYDFVDDVADSSGNQNDALNEQNITFVNSFNNVSYRAAEFDGATSKINCPPQTLSDMDDGFTATTWIQLPEVLTPNTRYPIFAQEGVMMAWLQTDASLNLSTKVYISPKTDFMIKEAVWNTDSVDVTMSIKSVSADRIYYAALMLKKLDLSVAEDVQALNNAFVQMGVAPQSNTTTEFTFSLTEATGIDGTNYPVSMIDNAYLYMRVVGDVYDLSSAKNVTVYQNEVPMFDSSVYNFVYTTAGPLHNFEALSMTNSSVTYLTDTVFAEEKTVAEYTGQSTHNVTFTPQNDFVLDVVFKQTGGTTDRHSVLELVTSAGKAILYVAHADYWRFNYLPDSGTNAATEIYAQGSSSGMQPGFDEWGRHTYVFRKQTGQVEFYYNGVKGNVVAENSQVTIVDGTTNVFTMDGFNPFDAENTLKIGYGNQGDQTEGTRIASMDIILDDQAFPEFATPAEVKDQTYTPTYTLSFASGTEANSFPTKSGSAQVFEIVPPTPPPFFETVTRSLDMSFEEYAINNVDIDSTGVTLNGTTYTSSGVGKVQTDENGFNYLEMGTSGKVTLPAYTDTASSINHTFYFVVRAADATTGTIGRMTGSTTDSFNLHINSQGTPGSTGFFPVRPNGNWQLSTTFNPKDTYLFVVVKLKYVSSSVYDTRIQFVAKPDGVFATAGLDTEQKNVGANQDVGTSFTIGSQHPEANNFKFYECGIIDKYVSDTEFDAIVDGLKTKYYAPASTSTPMGLVTESNATITVDPYIDGMYGTYTRRIVMDNGDIVHSTRDQSSGNVWLSANNAFVPWDNTDSTIFYATASDGPDGTYVALMYTFSNGPKTINDVVIQNGLHSNAMGYTFASSEVELYYLPDSESNIATASDRSKLVKITKTPTGQTQETGAYTTYTFDSPKTTSQIEVRLLNSSQNSYTSYKIIASIDFKEIVAEPTDMNVLTVKQVAYNPVDETQVVYWQAAPTENAVEDMYAVLLHPDLSIVDATAPVGDGSITRGDYELHQFVLSNPTNAAVQRYNTSVAAGTTYTQFSAFTHALTNMDGTTAPVDADTKYVAKAIVFDSSFAPVENVGYTPVGKQAIVFQKNAFSTVETFNLTHKDVWTVAFWYKTKATVSTVYNAISWGSPSLRTIEFNAGGFNFRTGQGHRFDYDFVNDQWYHIALTSTSGGIQNNTLTVYINGVVLAATSGGSQNPTAYTLPSKLALGMGVYNGSADDPWFSPVPYNSLMRHGLMTDVMMFDSTLTAADVGAMYNNTFDPSTSSTIIMHLMPSSDALSVVDSTGNFTVEAHQYSPDSTMIVPYEPQSDYGLTTAPNAVIFQNTPLSTIDQALTSTTLSHRDEWSLSFWYKSTIAFQSTTDGTVGNAASYLVQWKGDTSGHRAIEFNYGGVNMRTGQGHRWEFEFEVGRWYHVAFTSTSGDIQANTLFLYVDGVLVPTASGGSANPNNYVLPSKLNIGYGDGYDIANGSTYLMSDFVFYNTTLTPEEVNANFSQRQYTFGTKTPLLHYRFASESTKLLDSSANGFHLEPTTDGYGIAPEIIPTFMETLQVPPGIIVGTNQLRYDPIDLNTYVHLIPVEDTGEIKYMTILNNNAIDTTLTTFTQVATDGTGVPSSQHLAKYFNGMLYAEPNNSKLLSCEALNLLLAGGAENTRADRSASFFMVIANVSEGGGDRCLIGHGEGYYQQHRDRSIRYIYMNGQITYKYYRVSNDTSPIESTPMDYDATKSFVYSFTIDDNTATGEGYTLKMFHNNVECFSYVETNGYIFRFTDSAKDLINGVSLFNHTTHLYGVGAGASFYAGDIMGYSRVVSNEDHTKILDILLSKYEPTWLQVPSEYNLVGKYTGTDAHTISFTPPYDYLVDLTVNADSAQKVMDLQYGAETVSLNAADPWTLSGSFGEVSLEPFVETSQPIDLTNTSYITSTGSHGSPTHHSATRLTLTDDTELHLPMVPLTDFDTVFKIDFDRTSIPSGNNGANAYFNLFTGQLYMNSTMPTLMNFKYAILGDDYEHVETVNNYIRLRRKDQTITYISSMSVQVRPSGTAVAEESLRTELNAALTAAVAVTEVDIEIQFFADYAQTELIARTYEAWSSNGFYPSTDVLRFVFQGDARGGSIDMLNARYDKTPAAESSATSMNRFTLVARAATDSMEVYHDGLPAIVTKVSGSTTVTDNSFTLGADPTAQEVTLVIGGDQNGELLVESCDVVQSTQIITTFADPTYIAEKQWTLTYTQPMALNNVTPADTVLGWGKFDNYLKSDGTKLETGIEVEMWKDYFSVPIENVWGTGLWMIIKTIDGKYYGVGSDQYGQMGMPYTEMTSMTDAANVAETYYFKVPVELPHFAGYDIKKMLLRRYSTMFLTTEGKLYGMGKGEATHYCHFGTGTNSTQLNTITHLATDKVIKDFHQSGANTIILTTDNKLFTVGNNNEHGALGNGNTTSTNTFGEVATNITSTETIKQVYTTDGHSASGFFTESGRAFACGWGYSNQYHNGQSHPATNTSFVELKFSDGRKIKQFFMTPIRTWMVDESNDIYVGGAHYENTNGWPSGVFGPGGSTNGPTLIDSSINDGTEVLDILQQSTTGIVVVRAGGVYSFGRNDDGRLGNGDAVTTTTTTRAYKIADQHPIISFITTGLGPYMLIGYRTMAAIAPTLTDMDKITDVNTIGMDYGVVQITNTNPFVSMDSFSALDNLVNITGAVYSEHANIEKYYVAIFDVDSSIDNTISTQDLIALIESADVPANAKHIGGPLSRYSPNAVNIDLTHVYSATGTSIPIVADMMVHAYMIAVDEDGRVTRQFRLTGRKNMLVLGNTQEEILPEITFVNEYGQVSTWEEKSSRFTITSHITMKIGEDGIYFHNHPIFMQGNWTVIYWAYTGPNAEASGMVTEHPTAPAEVGWPLGRSINEPYKYNTVELSKYDSQNGNNQSWEWFGVYSGDGTFQSDGWSGRYESSPVRYTSWIQVGMVHDAVAKTMTAYHIRSPGNYTTYQISDVTFTATEGYLRLWRKYIHNNGTYQIDGVRILNNEVLTPEQISQDTRTTSQFTTVV
jgi:alpha-tubulin suppressor-like RCC1 family protein